MTKEKLLLLLLIFGSLILTRELKTAAFFLNKEASNGNFFSAGENFLPRVVINEIYYYPDEEHSSSNQDEEKFEWIEIYNLENYAIPLKNWSILKLLSPPANRLIIYANVWLPGRSFALIARDQSIWPLFWKGVPTNTLFIEAGANVRFELNNSRETLILMDNLGNLVDQVSYASGQKGHSWEREPAFVGNLVDRFPATPGR